MRQQESYSSNSKYPAHCPFPALKALQQREHSLSEDGGEEALTRSCTLQPQSQASSDTTGLPKCIARCWDDRCLEIDLHVVICKWNRERL